YTQSGGNLRGTCTLTLTGTAVWTGGGMEDAGTTVVGPGATLNLSGATATALFGGRTLSVAGTVNETGAGPLSISGAGTSLIIQVKAGPPSGTGTVVGNVTGAGSIGFGSGIGLPIVNGNVNLTGPFAVNITGTTAGTEFSQLNVNGTVTLSGPLNLTDTFAAP